MKTIIIDGNNLALRSFFAYDRVFLVGGSGKIYTSIIHGFLKTFIELKEKHKCDKFVVAWDYGSKRKKEIYPEYKQNRKSNNNIDFNDIKYSFKIVKKIIHILGIEQFCLNGEEADDVIATYIYKNKDDKITILSSDHDMNQLLSSNVSILKSSGEEITTRESFVLKYGFHPKFYPFYLSIKGDSGDNIPGVKGFGEKKTLSLIKNMNTYTLKELYENIGILIPKEPDRQLFIDSKNDIIKFYKIIKLRKDLEIQKTQQAQDKERLKKAINKMKLISYVIDDNCFKKMLECGI